MKLPEIPDEEMKKIIKQAMVLHGAFHQISSDDEVLCTKQLGEFIDHVGSFAMEHSLPVYRVLVFLYETLNAALEQSVDDSEKMRVLVKEYGMSIENAAAMIKADRKMWTDLDKTKMN